MLADLKFALRHLGRTPGFTIVTIATLALGIGACTALFSVINSLLYRPTPIHDLNRLVFGVARNEGEASLTSPAEYEAWSRHSRTTTAWGAAISGTAVLSGRGGPEQVSLASIDHGYLSTLGVHPQWGRAFTPDEIAANAPRAILSHAFWQARFAGDRQILGSALTLDGVPHTVVGILPPGFDLPRSNQVYRPYLIPAPGTPDRPARGIFPIARLAPGEDIDAATTEMQAISARLALDEPATQKGWIADLLPLRHQLLLDITGQLNRRLLLLSGAAGLLLLVACVNVGNLVLARSLARAREWAICAALGAGRGRILLRLLVENSILAGLGGLGGLLLALWLTPVLAAGNPVETVALTGLLTEPSFDLRVLGVTFLLVALTVIVSGLPAVGLATRIDLTTALQSGGSRGSSRGSAGWRDGLVIVEVALCLTLLAGAALLGKSFSRVLGEPLGFNPHQVLAVRVGPAPERYPDQAARHRFATAILEEVRRLPGVQSAGVVTTLPFHLDGWSAFFRPETGPWAASESPSGTTHRVVTPGYLETMGMTLLRGRLINEQDRADTTPVVVVSDTFARRFWPGEDPLGKRVRRMRDPDRWITVVGVVASVKEDREIGIRGDGPVWYLPYAQTNFTDPFHVVVRSAGNPALLGKAIAGAVAKIDPGQPVFEPLELESYVDTFLGPERFGATLLGAFALLGLLLAALGIYGVSAYLVDLRRREIGIRLALGATPGRVRQLVFRHSLRLLTLGTLLGLAGALALGAAFGSLLHEVNPHDPAVLLGVTSLLLLVALLANWLPARRAARVDPVIALRAE